MLFARYYARHNSIKLCYFEGSSLLWGRDVCCVAPSVYDCGACCVCCGVWTVFQKDCAKFLDGVSRCSVGAGGGQIFLFSSRCPVPIGCALHARCCLVAGPKRIFGNDCAGCACAVCCHGYCKIADERG